MTASKNQTKIVVRELDQALVMGNSVIIHQGKIVQETTTNDRKYLGYFKSKLYKKYFLPFWPQIFSAEKIPCILITDAWAKNYYHWLFEALTKLMILKEKYPNAKVILPSSYFKMSYVLESLKAFGIDKKDLVKIPKKSFLVVKKIAFLPHVNDDINPDYYDFPRFLEIKEKLISYFRPEFKINFGDKIYISRSNPNKRTVRAVENESEVVELLTRFGFKTVYMEDYSFIDQIGIMRAAKQVVATHGAGISNAVFMQENGNLIELLNENWLPCCFAKMAERSKIKYDRIICEQANKSDIKELANILVDTKILEQKLNNLA